MKFTFTLLFATGAWLPWVDLFTFEDIAKLLVVGVAGMAGGYARSHHLGETWRQTLATIFMGFVVAMFLSALIRPLLSPLLSAIDVGEFEELLLRGFISGLFGIGLVGLLFDYLGSRRAALTNGGSDDHDNG